MTTLERARMYLASCPPAISGSSGHSATFTVATALYCVVTGVVIIIMHRVEKRTRIAGTIAVGAN